MRLPDPHLRSLLVASRSPLAALRRARARPSASARTSFTVTLDDYLIRPQQLRVPEREASSP